MAERIVYLFTQLSGQDSIIYFILANIGAMVILWLSIETSSIPWVIRSRRVLLYIYGSLLIILYLLSLYAIYYLRSSNG